MWLLTIVVASVVDDFNNFVVDLKWISHLKTKGATIKASRERTD